jgi:L-aspartate oxidase
MLGLHPDAELAPRDVVARATYRAQVEERQPVLDARDAVGRDFPEHFPTVFAHAMEAGIDPRIEPIPVSPAVHYYMGGISADEDGRTSADGLWAVGEVSSTGVHGANRLASNSLLEGLVFGRRVAASVVDAQGALPLEMEIDVPIVALGDQTHSQHDEIMRLRRLMWDKVGVERDADRLTDALAEFDGVGATAGRTGVRNLAVVGRLVAQAALDRRESRGSHYRLDFPDLDESLADRRTVTVDPVPCKSFSVSGHVSMEVGP